MENFKAEQNWKTARSELERKREECAAKTAGVQKLNLAIHQLEMDKVQLRSQSDSQMKDMEMNLRSQLTDSTSKMGEKIQKLVGELERATRREEDCLALVDKMKQDHMAEQV